QKLNYIIYCSDQFRLTPLMMTEQENPAVTNFRNYIKIKTVHPHPDYASCTEYLQKQAKDLEAEFQVVECIPGKPAVIMTLLGEQPDLQSLLLNSHTDVVPVFPDYWKYDPFSAHKDENGDIYGRGTQDMKCVGIQYLEALKRLKKDGHKFLRTIHLTFVPDEELGGRDGMRHLVKMEVFKNMNIGLALDEGYASSTEKMEVFYGQRTPWRVTIECQGQPGHGSQFIPNTVGKKLRHIINSFLGYRDQQEQKLKDNPQLDLGDVTTVNLTYLKLMTKEVTCVEDGKNPWWDAFSAACKKENVQLEKKIFPASTDMKYVRQLGINALGFSPMNHTPRLLHDHNEFLNEKIFLRGIDIYYSIILNLANLKPY
ncbi:hypothetical protein OTU49_004969, partial [Cherax quadricarinatus]